ncbi:MAG: metal-sensing transcriptional repressor [Candidatus Izemoplasmatales bacterium]|jgi:DNA-binding FrmR family transcriptional regulator|nr:metal-sensing transcriptional repressor [Candidatus Izemoplasmatales bacterium]
MKADHDEVKKYLNMAKGQIEGIIKMVDDDRYCIDISHQLLASIAILKKTNQQVLKAHLESCVKNTLTIEGSQKINEIIEIMNRLNQ